MLVTHWMCKVRNWSVVRPLYESIIEEVEMGERDWEDDFSGHETMLPTTYSTEMSVYGEKSKKQGELYWCKGFQTGTCDVVSPHMAQVKVDDPSVPMVHMCAYCWVNHKKHKDHSESDCQQKSNY